MIGATDWTNPDTYFVVDNSYDQPRTANTVTGDIAAETQAINTTGTGDSWGAWFKTVANSALQYGMAKDATITRAELSRPVPMQYGTAQQVPMQRQNNMLVIGAIVLGAVLVLKK